MSEEKRQGRRKRQKQTYQHHKNAVDVTVYDPTGATIPAAVREELQDAVWGIASKNRLLINIAYE